MARRRSGRWRAAISLGVTLLAVLVPPPAHAQADLQQPVSGRELLNRAYSLMVEGRYDSARGMYDRAALAAGAANEEDLLRALNGSASTLVYAGHLDTAATVIQYALTRMDGVPASRGLAAAEIYALKAYLCSFHDQADSALAWNGKSMEIRRAILGDAHALLSSNYYNAGVALSKKGLFRDAVQDLKQALRLSGNGNESSQNRAQIHTLIASAYRECREFTPALCHLDTAIAELRSTGRTRTYGMMSAFLYAAHCHTARGDHRSALPLYDSAAAYARIVCPDNITVLTAIRASMAEAYLAMGDPDRAVEIGSDALERFGVLGVQVPSGVATIHADLARAYMERGDSVAALRHASEAVALRRATFGPIHPELAASYERLAEIEARTGRQADALAHLRDVVDMRRQLFAHTGAALLASPLISIAALQAATDDLQGAERTLHDVLSDERDDLMADPVLHARALKTYGDVRARKSEHLLAVAFYDSALQVLDRAATGGTAGGHEQRSGLADGRVYLDALKHKAVALRAAARRSGKGVACNEQALEAYGLFCRTLLSLRSRYGSEASKLRVGEDLGAACDQGVEIALELHGVSGDERYLRTAYAFAELDKAGMLLEGIRRMHVMSFAGVPDALVAADRSLKSRLTALEIEQATLSETPGVDPAKLRDLRWNILALQEESRLAAERLRGASPAYAHLMEEERFPAPEEIQATLDDSTLVLEYVLGQDRGVLFMVSRSGLTYRDLGSRRSIERATAALTSAIRTVDYDGFVPASRRAYELLIAPARTVVARYPRLVVVPDGVLSTLPFETLVSGRADGHDGAPTFARLPFLVRSHEIEVSPSARLLCEAVQGAPRPDPQSWSFAGFAPVFRDAVESGPVLASTAGTIEGMNGYRSVTVRGRSFRALPYSHDEVTGIGGAFGERGLASRIFTDGEASEENFKRIASTCTHLHVATHGIVNVHDPSRSALLFSPTGSSEGDDGVLHAAEAYDLPLHAELVVLSSCESGVGKIVTGEGVFALMRGFLYSGARNVMYSLWRVTDRNTSALMRTFYQEALKGVRPGKALQLAKIAMLANERTAFPHAWGSFVLVGP